MSSRARWLLTLTAVVALGAGAACFADALQRALRAGAQAAVLQREADGLEQALALAREEQPKIATWRQAAELARQAGLEPRKWRTYPVTISRDLAWEDVAGVVLIASNALPRPGEYWFQPATLRVVRAEQAAPPRPSDAPVQAGTQAPERYDMHFEGHFLIPERNQP